MSDQAPTSLMAGQIGTAFAARNQRASLRSVGVFTNRYLLASIVAEILLADVFYAPPTQALLGISPLPVSDLPALLAYLVIGWGADEFVRHVLRRRAGRED